MRIDTLNLYSASLCSKRWSIEGYEKEPFDDVRNAFKELAFYSSRRNARGLWDIKDIAVVWDEIFWDKKKRNIENRDLSIAGLLKLKKLFFKLPEVFTTYQSDNLFANVDSNIVITSSADFLTSTQKETLLWVYTTVSTDQLKRSILPAAERFVIDSSIIGGIRDKSLAIMNFYINESGIRAEKITCNKNDTAVKGLTVSLHKKIFYPVYSKQCKDCSVKCWENKEE